MAHLRIDLDMGMGLGAQHPWVNTSIGHSDPLRLFDNLIRYVVPVGDYLSIVVGLCLCEKGGYLPIPDPQITDNR